jgi:hypothetical protein
MPLFGANLPSLTFTQRLLPGSAAALNAARAARLLT